MYERKKATAQSKNRKEKYEKYIARERNRVKDFKNKLSASLRRLFPNTIHVFEDLDKDDLVNRKEAKTSRRKRNSRTPWRSIHRRMSEVTLTAFVPSGDIPRECPRCDLEMNRQRVTLMSIKGDTPGCGAPSQQ